MNIRHTWFRTVRPLALALVVTGAAAAQTLADERYRPEASYHSNGRWGSQEHSTADGRIVDVQIQVDGRTAPLYFRPERFDRHYFQAFKGRNYAVVLRNTTSRRIGVVISVDGLNVVNGERSSLARNESMYVLNPYERAVIRGWRTSLDEVRRFVFVDEERSYAERTGQANGDMGWIRVAAFREDEPVSIWRPRSWSGHRDGPHTEGNDEAVPFEREGARPESQKSEERAGDRRMMGESAPSAPESAPGTGWGERRHDRVEQTHFRAERIATDQLVLRYEYASGLRALGIFPKRVRRVWEREQGDLGFAQPPRW